jgi:hypothetical protein
MNNFSDGIFVYSITFINPAMLSAIFICLGPVHRACGRISLKITTKRVEIMMAADAGRTASKKIGSDSNAKAFAINKVDNKT